MREHLCESVRRSGPRTKGGALPAKLLPNAPLPGRRCYDHLASVVDNRASHMMVAALELQSANVHPFSSRCSLLRNRIRCLSAYTTARAGGKEGAQTFVLMMGFPFLRCQVDAGTDPTLTCARRTGKAYPTRNQEVFSPTAFVPSFEDFC